MLAEGDLCWTPSAASVEGARMADFVRWLELERGLQFDEYEGLWRWSVTNTAEFWSALWSYFDILSDKPFEAVMTSADMISTAWFPGVTVNYAEHMLRHEANAAPDEVAIHHSSEIRPFATMTWAELGNASRRVATKMRVLGIRPGDRVVSYMPNVPETAIAMLAATAIGAVWSTVSPEFGVKTVVDRFSQIEPKLLFAADGYSFGGKLFDRRAEVVAIAKQLPSLEKIVWLPYLGLECPEVPEYENMHWDDLLATSAPAREQFSYERVHSQHPLWVLFSSGTTGPPKAIAHSHVGMVLDQTKQMLLHFDLKPGEALFFYTTTGWMMWNSVLSALLAGASAVLYDGSPTWPAPDALWTLAEKTPVTMFGVSPTLVSLMNEANMHPGLTHNLLHLRKVLVGGAPSTPATFEWLYNNVKSDLWVMNTSGGTDLCGGLVGSVPSRPVRAAEIQGRLLGIAVEAWDDAGKPVIGEVGELVITRPFPSQPLFFWGDAKKQRLRETYFSTYPGVWRHGDFIKVNQDGGCYIYGRADATLNRFGIRIGTSEIYTVLSRIERVVDSAIVCCETADGGFFMPLFVELCVGDTLDDLLVGEIKSRLRQEASPRHVPDIVLQVPKVPYTLTGKKMEVPLRKLIMGMSASLVASPDAMVDSTALDWFEEFAQRPEVNRLFLHDLKVAAERRIQTL
jgi:acetoacetyl-CoA synthetase